MFRMILAFCIGFTIIVSANYYVSFKVFELIKYVFPTLNRGVLIAFIIISVLAFTAVFLPGNDDVNSVLRCIGAYWMGLFIYLLLAFAIRDLVFLILKFCSLSSAAVGFWTGLGALVFALGISAYGVYNSGVVRHTSYEMEITGKGRRYDTRVVLVSDIHLGSVGSEKRLSYIVDEINSLKPEVVCIAGDIFDNDYTKIKDPEKVASELRRIESDYGVYACLGNHDSGKTFTKLKDILDKGHVEVLDDSHTLIEDRFVLVGRLDQNPIGGYDGITRKSTAEVMKKVDSVMPVVVMDHNPANIGEYEKKADLVLCGHTHKGQIFPGSIITGLMYDVDYGYYRKDAKNPHVVVSSGAGTWGMPMRVGTACEVVSIDIKFN